MDQGSEKWEFSLLVDQTSRVLEARGLFELYLGGKANQITGRPLLSFFDESERLPFLRYMARLLVRGQAEPVSATLRTPAVGIKRFSMAAKVGEAGRSWWLLFAQDVKGVTVADTLDSGGQPYATAQELDIVARVHDHAAAPLDITVFRARAISDETTSALSAAQRQEIDDEFSRTLMDHAQDRMVARPATGESALLHARNMSPEAIRDQLAAVASSHNLRAADLGIEHETVHLDPGIGAAEAIRDLRRKLQTGGQPVETAPPLKRSRTPIFIAAACILVAIVAVVVFYGRS
jgi:hypothetical protein